MNGTKYTMLILGIEMAGSSKNATPKFFPRVAEDLPYKEIRGEGRGVPRGFSRSKSVQNDAKHREGSKKMNFIFHQKVWESCHNSSTTNFGDKLIPDFDLPPHFKP